MKPATVAFSIILLVLRSASAQTSPDLTVTLPTGKTITFQSVEQKEKYENTLRQRSQATSEWDKFYAQQNAARATADEVAKLRGTLEQISVRADIRIILFTPDGVEAGLLPYLHGSSDMWSGKTCFVKGDFRAKQALDGQTFSTVLFALGVKDDGGSREAKFTLDPVEALTNAGIAFSSKRVVAEAVKPPAFLPKTTL